jgi:hypothetical protein
MGLIIAVVIIGIIGGVLTYYGYGFIEDLFFGFLFWGGISLFVLSLFAIGCETTPVKVSEQKIYALKDNSQTNGSFFLGSGTIDEEQYFFYVIDTEKGKRIEKQLADESYVVETNNETPKVVTYERRYKSAFARFMYGDTNGNYEYRFYVPKNTITTDFTIDLE